MKGQQVVLPPHVEDVGDEESQDSTVQECRRYQSQLQYRIQWTGYDSMIWDRANFVDGLQAVHQFHQHYLGNPGLLENVLGGP